MNYSHKKAKNFYFLLLLIISIEIIFNLLNIKNPLLVKPSELINLFLALIENGQLPKDLMSSIQRLLPGYLLGTLLGIFFGFLLGLQKKIGYFLSPFFLSFKNLPPVALIPFFIVLFGIGENSKIITIAFGSFFPTWLAVYLGCQNINKFYLWSAKVLNLSWYVKFTKVIFPATAINMLDGLRQSGSLAVMMVFVSELSGAQSGIGYRIIIGQLTYRFDLMILSLLTLALVGFLLDKLLVYAFPFLFPWIKKINQYRPLN